MQERFVQWHFSWILHCNCDIARQRAIHRGLLVRQAGEQQVKYPESSGKPHD